MNKKGVTLMELVIVMAIIAIGAVLMAPNIGAWLPHYRLRGAARDIVSTMRVAQMKAVSSNVEYQVSFDPVAGTYVLQRHTGGAWVNEGVPQTLPQGVQITNPAGSTAIQFNPNSTASSASITLRNDRNTQRKISVASSTGRVKIE